MRPPEEVGRSHDGGEVTEEEAREAHALAASARDAILRALEGHI